MIPSRAAVKIRIRGNEDSYWQLGSLSQYLLSSPRWGAWINASVDSSVKFRDVGGL